MSNAPCRDELAVMRGAGERPESIHLRLEDPSRVVERLRDAEEPHGGDRAHCVIAKGLRSPHLIALRPVHSAFARRSGTGRGSRRIRHVELQVLPVDEEHRGIGRTRPSGEVRLQAAFEVPRVLLAIAPLPGGDAGLKPPALKPRAKSRRRLRSGWKR